MRRGDVGAVSLTVAHSYRVGSSAANSHRDREERTIGDMQEQLAERELELQRAEKQFAVAQTLHEIVSKSIDIGMERRESALEQRERSLASQKETQKQENA